MAIGPALVRRLATAMAHVFYRVDTIGRVPADGALILLPNHPNALLDPALVLATAGRPVRFLAKSTLFKGPFAPLLKGARAIPVYRQQDGAAPRSNDQTFRAVDAALARGEAVCIFPEGISHSSGRLEPLRTGAARMALSAAARGVAVRLVPIGINLERKTAFRSRATVAYGAVFTVDEQASAGESDGTRTGGQTDHGEGEGRYRNRVGALTDRIASHMRALLVEADPVADAELVDRIDRLYRSERGEPGDARAALARRQAIADGLHRLRTERPDWYGEAVIQLKRYADRLHRFGLHDTALDWQITPAAARTFVVRELPRALVLVPIAVAAVAIFALPYSLTAAAGRVTKDTDVTATAKVFAGAVIYSVWIILLATASGWLGGPLAAALALAGLPVLAAAGLFAIEREVEAWQTARSWLALRGAHPGTREALRRRRAELADVLDRVNDWLVTGARRDPIR